MRHILLGTAALSLAIPASLTLPTGQAQAQSRVHHRATSHHRYHGCRHSSGTTGLIAGGVGGALVGRSIVGHGLLGTAAGAVGGAFAGRAIDRTITAKHRCR